MKNIIWQQPSGELAVYSLADDMDSAAEAVRLLSVGTICEDWIAVGFDVELPGPPQSLWRWVDGQIVTIPAPPKSKDVRISEKLVVRGLTLENEWLLYAGMAGMLSAAMASGKTEAQLIAANTGYRNAKTLANEIAAIRSEP